ncbi:MAG: cell division transport system permease protein [Actinomycetota bacterium]|jgi:hypothetical protein|nr:cell division transport system permease protein [Actinomycetota bacterium]
MRTDELRRELAVVWNEIAPFTGDVRTVRRRVARRRAVTASLVVLLLVTTVVGVITARGGGHRRVEVTTTHKQLGPSQEMGHVSGWVVPNDSSAGRFASVQQTLETSSVVEQYEVFPAGTAAEMLALTKLGFPAKPLPTVCSALHTRLVAVQLRSSPDAATRLRDSLGKDAKLYTNPNDWDMEVLMKVGASLAQTRAIQAALAADHDLTSSRFVDHQAAYDVFKKDFSDQPALVESTKPSDLPESFRVRLAPAASRATVEHRYGVFPGVDTAAGPPGGTLGDAFFPDSLAQQVCGTNDHGSKP